MQQHSDWVRLRSPHLQVEIDPLGAQLSTLRNHDGADLLWNGDSAVWSGRAPLLFPIVGTLNGGSYRVGPRRFSLPRHGFARTRRFEVRETTGTAASFRLAADAATLQAYPFRFELDVEFVLSGATLSITTSVRNLGDTEMQASFGYHPAFRWPLPFGRPRSEHFIEFAADEPQPIRRLNSAGLVKPTQYPTPVSSRRLRLADALFEDDVLIFESIHSRSVLYGAQGTDRIRVGLPDAPDLGLWTKPGAGFICIEPWHGMSDPEGFSGELSAKPGVFRVAPGGIMPIRMTIELTQTE